MHPFYGLSGAVRCVIPYSSLTNLTPQPLFSPVAPSPLLLFLLFSPHLFIKLMRLKLGPSSQGEREGAKQDTQGRRGRPWECVRLNLSVSERACMCWSALSVCLCIALEYALCRHLHRFWHIHRGAGCDMKSASSSASGSVPLWIQKSVLWHGPFTSSPACSSIYLCVLWSRAVCAGFGFSGCFWLSAWDRERENERERKRFCHYRLTAKPCWGCCGNKTLGTSGCVVNEEEYRFIHLFAKKKFLWNVLSIMWLNGDKHSAEGYTEHSADHQVAKSNCSILTFSLTWLYCQTVKWKRGSDFVMEPVVKGVCGLAAPCGWNFLWLDCT